MQDGEALVAARRQRRLHLGELGLHLAGEGVAEDRETRIAGEQRPQRLDLGTDIRVCRLEGRQIVRVHRQQVAALARLGMRHERVDAHQVADDIHLVAHLRTLDRGPALRREQQHARERDQQGGRRHADHHLGGADLSPPDDDHEDDGEARRGPPSRSTRLFGTSLPDPWTNFSDPPRRESRAGGLSGRQHTDPAFAAQNLDRVAERRSEVRGEFATARGPSGIRCMPKQTRARLIKPSMPATETRSCARCSDVAFRRIRAQERRLHGPRSARAAPP